MDNHYGIIGLISAIWVYIQLLIKSVIQAVKNSSKWEGRISYPKMLAVILGTYYISFFGVHQIDEKRIFFCLIFLLIAYCNNKAYITEYGMLCIISIASLYECQKEKI